MTPAAAVSRRRRARGRVLGIVQGVGFRPYVYRLARELELGGEVRNDARGVVVDVEGEAAAVEAFVRRLPAEAPPLARVESVSWQARRPQGRRAFAIGASHAGGRPDALVSPDTATCDACLAELFDPADRRFRYPFVNCTDCGPRFTIVRGVPYDRPLTTMAGFRMCAACQAEYDDPGDRRFHAQPNACPACGPAARLADSSGRTIAAGDAVAAAAALLRDGAVLAVKGIGGYHLACRAGDEAAVSALRARKHREDKPFALMVRDVDTAHALVALGPEEAAALAGADRPIVLAARRRGAPVAAAVAPGLGELGVMLPYAPLHHLLLADAGGPLVLTSGNVSDEPIAHRDGDALARLSAIADAFLLHDRPIHTRTDDSVVRVVRAPSPRTTVLRRSRGQVPGSLVLPVAAERPLLACGAELKSTFCVARGRRAWLSHHVGDLKNVETLEAFTAGIEHFERLFDVRPALVAHDLHPDLLSTAYAAERDGVELVAVQHHHGHLAAALAEHGLAGRAVGAIYDGAGLGSDGSIWGGELLVGDLRSFERVGHLRPVRLPGGDRAAREPWRMACAWLREAAGGREPPIPSALAGIVDPARWDAVARLAGSELGPPTTSMGRLFDAVAALCGVRARATYEGQAAIELEAIADPAERGAYPLPIAGGVLDARPAVRAVAADVAAGVAAGAVSARFHAAVARATAGACAAAASEAGVDVVVLAGGVFQNRLLLERTAVRLGAAGLRVVMPERVPANDGGIAFGQAAIAAARDGERD